MNFGGLLEPLPTRPSVEAAVSMRDIADALIEAHEMVARVEMEQVGGIINLYARPKVKRLGELVELLDKRLAQMYVEAVKDKQT